MKERPILFNGDMVRAILEGRKTQTRRVMKPQPEKDSIRDEHWWPSNMHQSMVYIESEMQQWQGLAGDCFPHGGIGDRLWVRETWSVHPAMDEYKPSDISTDNSVDYIAGPDRFSGFGKTRPSIFMPRWASRITLEITAVRVERLQDISEEDAKAEGARRMDDLPGIHPYGQDCRWSMESPKNTEGCLSTARWAFANYWCKLARGKNDILFHEEYWDANPWVWVIEFKRVDV